MAKVKSQGNHSTEIRLVRLFRAHGVSGWRRHQDIEGSPDFVFPKARVMVFVDGCFWLESGEFSMSSWAVREHIPPLADRSSAH
jgi:G:T-mismatch repair DNA endonuclease (very short patch repair protein)